MVELLNSYRFANPAEATRGLDHGHRRQINEIDAKSMRSTPNQRNRRQIKDIDAKSMNIKAESLEIITSQSESTSNKARME